MSFRDIQKFAESNLLKTVTQVRTGLPYILPKTHPDWQMLSAIAAIMLSCDVQDAPDQGTALHTYMWQVWVENRYPLYCLSNELLRQFEQTEADNLASLIPDDWVPPFPLFLVCLPNNAVLSPAGAWCPYILVLIHHPDLEKMISGEHEKQISIGISDNAEVVWVSGSGYMDGKIIESNNQLGGSKTDQAEHDWLKKVFAIALQSLLTISYMPELIEETPQSEPSSVLSKGNRSPAPKKLYPRWIGRSFERKGGKRSRTGTHASPATHWRKGHWRQQVCGEGRQQRRLIRIKPMLINAEE